jgi:hypothetical protein
MRTNQGSPAGGVSVVLKGVARKSAATNAPVYRRRHGNGRKKPNLGVGLGTAIVSDIAYDLLVDTFERRRMRFDEPLSLLHDPIDNRKLEELMA